MGAPRLPLCSRRLTLTPNLDPNPLSQAHLASLSAYFARFGLWTRYRGNPSLVPPSARPSRQKHGSAAAMWRYALQCLLCYVTYVSNKQLNCPRDRYALQCVLLDMRQASAGSGRGAVSNDLTV